MLRSSLLLLLALAATPCQAELPKLYTKAEFTCVDLAEAANYYIRLGEAEGIKQLEAHTVDWDSDWENPISRNERVGWVCRIVFKSKGKEPLRAPRYGGHQLPWLSMPLERWPLYPVAAAGDSYFVLAEGYSLFGSPEDPWRYLKYCRTEGTFRDQPIPVPTRKQALQDLRILRTSDTWKEIRWQEKGEGTSYIIKEEQVWRFIAAQAERLPSE
jgi:hypothetical protein